MDATDDDNDGGRYRAGRPRSVTFAGDGDDGGGGSNVSTPQGSPQGSPRRGSPPRAVYSLEAGTPPPSLIVDQIFDPATRTYSISGPQRRLPPRWPESATGANAATSDDGRGNGRGNGRGAADLHVTLNVLKLRASRWLLWVSDIPHVAVVGAAVVVLLLLVGVSAMMTAMTAMTTTAATTATVAAAAASGGDAADQSPEWQANVEAVAGLLRSEAVATGVGGGDWDHAPYSVAGGRAGPWPLDVRYVTVPLADLRAGALSGPLRGNLYDVTTSNVDRMKASRRGCMAPASYAFPLNVLTIQTNVQTFFNVREVVGVGPTTPRIEKSIDRTASRVVALHPSVQFVHGASDGAVYLVEDPLVAACIQSYAAGFNSTI